MKKINEPEFARKAFERAAAKTAEQIKADWEQFLDHLRRSSEIVAEWPEWKQNILGRTEAQAKKESE